MALLHAAPLPDAAGLDAAGVAGAGHLRPGPLALGPHLPRQPLLPHVPDHRRLPDRGGGLSDGQEEEIRA